MTDIALTAPARPVLATIRPGQVAQLHRILCVGRNYAEHAREMGHDPDAEPPFFFIKPASALVPSGAGKERLLGTTAVKPRTTCLLENIL